MINLLTALAVSCGSLGAKPSDGCVYLPGKKVFHKPGCSFVKGKKALPFKPKLLEDGFKPCLMCFSKEERGTFVDKKATSKRSPFIPAFVPNEKTFHGHNKYVSISNLRKGRVCKIESETTVFSVLEINKKKRFFTVINGEGDRLKISGIDLDGLKKGDYIQLPQVFRVKTQKRLKTINKKAKVHCRYASLVYEEGPRHVIFRNEFQRLKTIGVGQVGTLGSCKVQQIVGQTQLLVVWRPSIWIWLEGIRVGDRIDGITYTFTNPFRITGTKTYKTVIGGSKTVFVASPFKKSTKEFD